MAIKHTQGPWRYFLHRNKERYRTIFIVESDARKLMFTSEVWDVNSNPKWRKANPGIVQDHRKTLREVEANTRLVAAAPTLHQIVTDCEIYIERAVKGENSPHENAVAMLKALREALHQVKTGKQKT